VIKSEVPMRRVADINEVKGLAVLLASAASSYITGASFTIDGGTTVYSTAPTVSISGGGGSGATATAVLTSGVVTAITITNGGAGYTSAPSITFSGGTITVAGVQAIFSTAAA